MIYIFLDESGDLGFDFSKKNITNKFVITLLICSSNEARKSIKKAIERTIKNKHKKKEKTT